MDAHLLRRLCEVLTPLLLHARLEKIQSLSEFVFSFVFHTSKGKQQLCLRFGRQHSFLFLTSHRLSAGTQPTSEVMRLRKYIQGQRVRSVIAFPFQRQIWLLFGSENRDKDTLPWLLLDLREGVLLRMLNSDHIPEEEVPVWPKLSLLESACAQWQDWPVLTPKLRRVLTRLDPAEGRALVADLMVGGGDIFLYRQKENGHIASVSAFPNPDYDKTVLVEERDADPLHALEMAGQHLVFEDVARVAQQQALHERARKRKKLEKLAAKLNEEQLRLEGMCAASETAQILQASLWRTASNTRCARLNLPAEGGLPAIDIPLDPRYTILENMQRLFHSAERGRRGLEHLKERRRALDEQMENLSLTSRSRGKNTAIATSTEIPTLPHGVQAFVSSDGFLLFRGRSAKGNLSCRKLGRGHDIWLHVENGPGAHVVIRRAYPGQDVPERTLMEAGGLAAVRSWQQHSSQAQVQYAEIRHIKPMRGAAEGTVRIDKVLFTRTVPVDAGLEEKLLP